MIDGEDTGVRRYTNSNAETKTPLSEAHHFPAKHRAVNKHGLFAKPNQQFWGKKVSPLRLGLSEPDFTRLYQEV